MAENFPEASLSIQAITHLLDTIKKKTDSLANRTVMAGFDGFVDTIVRIIKTKDSDHSISTFNQIKEFGDYILGKQGSSFSLELEERSIKLGGNMPIMANAMAQWGPWIHCIGALGFPKIHPVFENMSQRCLLHSFTDPGPSTAYEFDDGKILMAEMNKLNKAGWHQILEAIGKDNLIRIFSASEMLCIVNWSEIDSSTEIWKGVLRDIIPFYANDSKKQIAFFDLSDCSKRKSELVIEALELLKEFGRTCRVILSMNKNEASLVHEALFGEKMKDGEQVGGSKIRNWLGIETVLLHSSKSSKAIYESGYHECQTFYTNVPAISTGAGDHFNAGFCVASLLGLDIYSCIIFANMIAGYYIRTGKSPGWTDLAQWKEEMNFSLKERSKNGSKNI